MTDQIPHSSVEASKAGWGRTLLIIFVTMIVTVAITYWFVRTYIYARDFTPVELSSQESLEVNRKLRILGYDPEPVQTDPSQEETDQQWLRPEPYQETDSAREVSFSERELNGIIAANKDLARKLAIDLSDDLVSARLLLPLDQDLPILGGKTLRLSAGLELSLTQTRPKVVLKGVSLMGVPIPAAWLGGLKNVDLIDEFGDQQGFWSDFANGVENIEVKQGHFKIKLKP